MDLAYWIDRDFAADAARRRAEHVAVRPVSASPSRTLDVFGLLVIDEESERYPNLRAASSAVSTYTRCAALMAKSAHSAGHQATIVTNRAEFIADSFAKLGVPSEVKVEQRSFSSRLPKNTLHRSAHHKLDLMKSLAKQSDGLSALIDLDAVFLRPLPISELASPDTLGVYDITGDMALESNGRAGEDVVRLADRSIARPRWFGGETIIGTKAAYRKLCDYVTRVEPDYYEQHADLYHSGDETIVSTALNLLLADGGSVTELGSRDIVQRWWSSRRSHSQRRFTDARSTCILHLPADKEYLAQQADQPFNSALFLKSYEAHARRKVLTRQVSNLLHRFIPGKPRMTTPRI